METVDLWQSLATQAPGVVGVIAVVLIFVKYLEKRDSMFLTQLSSVADKIEKVSERIEDLEKVQQRHLDLYIERGKVIQRIDKKINVKNRTSKK